MKVHPVPVLLLSSLTREGAEVTLRGLELGALDFVDKSRVRGNMNLLDLGEEIKEKIRALAGSSALRLKQMRAARGGRLSEELRTLEYSQRLSERARAVLAGPGSTGRVLFESAVAGGARACGRDAGAIEAGRLADLMTLDGERLALAGLDGDMALDGWIFAGDDRAVRDVWSAGRRLVVGGHHFARAAVEARYRAVLARLRDAV